MTDYITHPPEDADPWLVLEEYFQRLTGDPFWYHVAQGAVLSPPYNANVPYGAGLPDSLPLEHYAALGRCLAWMLDWVLEPGAQAFINLKPVMSNPMAVLHFLTNGLLHPEQAFYREEWDSLPGTLFQRHVTPQWSEDERGFWFVHPPSPWKIENWITWQFSGTTPAPTGPHSWGHFTPSSHANRLHNTWEWVLHLRRSRDPAPKLDKLALGVEYVDQSNVRRFGAQGRKNLRCRGNHWAIPYRTKKNRVPSRHPAQYPVELVDHCLALMGLPAGSLVIDPCAGVQNTGLACAKRKLRYVGVEISPQYCAEGREKLKEAYSEKF